MGAGETVSGSDPPWWYFPRRYNVVWWTFLCITLAYMIRSNLSIAIVQMSEEYGWQPSSKGIFLSSFFWGYITTQLVGGVAARKLGAKFMLSFVVVVPSIFTMLIPLVAAWSPVLFVACRVIIGAAAGATFPTMYHMMSKWSPYEEKARLLAIVSSGVNLGTIIIDTVGPVIINHLGWPFVFYLSGAVGFVWLIFWILTVKNSPEEMKNIHPSEVKYIRATTAADERKPIINADEKTYVTVNSEEKPHLENKEALYVLIQHKSFWVLVWGQLCVNWGSYVFLTWLPTYVHSVLGYPLQISGVIAICPNISTGIISIIASVLCDKLLSRGYKLKYLRKFFGCFGCLGYIATLVILAYRDQLHLDPVLSAVVLAVGSGSGGFFIPGFAANNFDIAPYHPSLVVGITNTAGTVPGIVGVFTTGLLLQHGFGWSFVWLLTAAFYFGAMVTYMLFADTQRLV